MHIKIYLLESVRSFLGLIVAFGWLLGPPVAAGQVGPGVVVLKVSAAPVASSPTLKKGDLIVAWQSSGQNPAIARYTDVVGIFDWFSFLAEESSRGEFELEVIRGDERLLVPTGALVEWTEVRPNLEGSALGIYEAHSDGVEKRISFQALLEEIKSTTDDSRPKIHAELWLRIQIAEFHRKQGEWPYTVTEIEDAIDEAIEPFVQGYLLRLLGNALRRQGLLDEASTKLQAARTSWISVHGEGSMSDLRIRLDQIAVMLDRGELEEVALELDSLLELCKILAPDSTTYALLENNYSVVQVRLGNFSKGTAALERSLAVRERLVPGTMAHATTLGNLAYLKRLRNHIPEAVADYKRSLEILESTSPEDRMRPRFLNNLAAALAASGSLNEAERLYFQALEIEQRGAPESRTVGLLLNNLAGIAMDRLDYRGAAALYRESLEIRRKVSPQSFDVAQSLGNLAVLHLETKNYEQAQEFAVDAWRIRSSLAPRSLDTASSLHTLAAIAWMQRDISGAKEFIFESMKILQEIGVSGKRMASNFFLLAEMAQHLGENEEATALLQRALEIRKRAGAVRLPVARIYEKLGAIAQDEKDSASLTLFEEGLKAYEGQLPSLGGAASVRAEYRASLSDFYEDAISAYLDNGMLRSAYFTSERYRARVFLESLAERELAHRALPPDLSEKRQDLSSSIDRTLRLLGSGRGADQGSRELRRLHDELRRVEEEIRRRAPDVAEFEHPRPLSVEETQLILDRGTLLLSFKVNQDSVVIFAIDSDSYFKVKEVSLGREKLREMVQGFNQLIRESTSETPGRKSTLTRSALDLYSSLLKPFAQKIAMSERVLLVPDGPLHYLPWAALARRRHDASIQYLAEWVSLHTVLSATVYKTLLAQRSQYSCQDCLDWDFVGIGNNGNSNKHALSSLSTSNTTEPVAFQFEPLPAVYDELGEISSLYDPRRVRILLGTEATEEAVERLRGRFGAVHFAAHGQVSKSMPLYSFLALSKGPEGDSSPNGLLQVWEILERVRLEADLVVLSACETALGDDQGGEGLVGLTRAFQFAGAQTVAASLWRVDDHGTSELMVRFYQHLKSGVSKDEALRRAQIELIQGSHEESYLAAPIYWAGFQLYGDWR